MTLHVRRALAIASVPVAQAINAALAEAHGLRSLSAEFVGANDADDADPTHLGCDSQFVEAQVQPFIEAFGSLVSWCDVDAVGYVLRATNVAALEAQIGEVVRMRDLIAACGLKRRVVSMAAV